MRVGACGGSGGNAGARVVASAGRRGFLRPGGEGDSCACVSSQAASDAAALLWR